MKLRKYYLKELQLLLSDEDLTDEKLREASEGLLPNILDFLSKKKVLKKWCILVNVDSFNELQKWSGLIELNYGVFLFHDKTWSIRNASNTKEISFNKFIKLTSK